MAMPRVLLCVDMSYQVYRATAAHPGLSSRRVFTGGLYGFFTTLAKMVRETRATHLALCMDSKPYKRSIVYPDYKQLARKGKIDEEVKRRYLSSMDLVTEALEHGGFRRWAIHGFEADDFPGHCVMKYRHRFDRIYAASNDSDLWQLLWCENFAIYRKDIGDCVTGKWLMDNHGLTPEQFMLATALQGTHNDIEGIPNVGEKTSRAAVKDPAKLRVLREKWGALIDRNLALIELPHPDFPRGASIPKHALSNVSAREMWSFLGDFDIEITGSMSRMVDQLMEAT